jgi:hypothetical protein
MSPRGKNRFPRRSWIRAPGDRACTGPLEVGERLREVVSHPLDRSEPDPGPALLSPGLSRVERALIRRSGAHRVAEILQDVGVASAKRSARVTASAKPRSTRRRASS